MKQEHTAIAIFSFFTIVNMFTITFSEVGICRLGAAISTILLVVGIVGNLFELNKHKQ
jgi:hypothetical protein